VLNIEKPGDYRISLLHLGFRPFFMMASLFAVIGMGAWSLIYFNPMQLPSGMSAITWHAHEMIYGYAMAVVTGFLLTALRNWTGVQTLNGFPLLLLVGLWLVARVVGWLPVAHATELMAMFDLAYNLLFVLAAGYPLVRARQWKQMSVWSKLLFLLAGNLFFYAGLLGYVSSGVTIGLYTGLYIIVSLILLMGRRVIPFFIEKKTSGDVTIVNRKWVDISSLVLMLVFLVVEVYWPLPVVAAVTALALFIIHVIRLSGWYAPGIWREPMLWTLYIGYGWIVLGFLLRGLAPVWPLPPALAVHAFAVGGIGLITLGMMARVSLGHTGRDVYRYPAVIKIAFVAVALAAFIRVVMPIVLPVAYQSSVATAQLFWVAGFAILCFVYLPYWIYPRTDGRYG